ncbi:MAG TPA: DUF1801 domain-containing protein [Longimicrobiales bacterium]|nr:DUF1801 domain-containing protein [Longimicrobiales bacterium]
MTVKEYLKSLPPERLKEIARVREVVVKNLPKGFEEVVGRGMLVYQVPFDQYSDTYNGEPLWFASIDGGRKKMAVHLMPIYGDASLLARVQQGFAKSGKKPDMGKACIRFKSADDLPLKEIGEVVAALPMKRWIEIAQAARKR